MKKRTLILIVIGIVLFITYSPIIYFEAQTNIEAINSINYKKVNGFRAKVESHKKGVSWNQQEIKLEDDKRIKVNKSTVSNFAFYSKISKEISFERTVNNEIVETVMNVESEIWGLGALKTKENNFNDIIKRKVDEIFLKS